MLIAVEAAADTFVRRMASTGNHDIVLAVLGAPRPAILSSGLLQRKKTFRVKPAGNRHQPGCDRPEAIAVPPPLPPHNFSAQDRDITAR